MPTALTVPLAPGLLGRLLSFLQSTFEAQIFPEGLRSPQDEKILRAMDHAISPSPPAQWVQESAPVLSEP